MRESVGDAGVAGPLDIVERAVSMLRRRLELVRSERATGEVTVRVFVKDGQPNSAPKVGLETNVR